ncbi:MAG: formate dehydrogenase accessory protein FdhE [Acidobacteriota bacterium]
MNNKPNIELPDGYVDFYKQVETWQNEVFFRLKKGHNPENISAIQLLNEHNQPILSVMSMEIDADLYKGAFLEFARLVKNERGQAGEKIDRIIADLDNVDFTDLAQKIINNETDHFAKLAEQAELSTDLVWFMLDHSLRPFLRHFALPYQESLKGDDLVWAHGVCPICGSQAHYSRIRAEDGRRFLFCEHCFTEWEHMYLSCIYCGNTEPKTVRYFVIEGDDANQVFVCDKCRGYLKTFDERKGSSKVDMFIAGIETVHLDLIAEEEGYSNKVSIERDFN